MKTYACNASKGHRIVHIMATCTVFNWRMVLFVFVFATFVFVSRVWTVVQLICEHWMRCKAWKNFYTAFSVLAKRSNASNVTLRVRYKRTSANDCSQSFWNIRAIKIEIRLIVLFKKSPFSKENVLKLKHQFKSIYSKSMSDYHIQKQRQLFGKQKVTKQLQFNEFRKLKQLSYSHCVSPSSPSLSQSLYPSSGFF